MVAALGRNRNSYVGQIKGEEEGENLKEEAAEPV